MPTPFDVFAACQPGLEPLLKQELTALGAASQKQRGGVAFKADQALLLRAGLWLGTPTHLLLRVASFRCRALGELERKARDLPWREWLRPRVPLDVHATTKGSRVYHTGAAAERITNGIAAALGATPPTASVDDDVAARVHVRFRDDVCTVSLDATSTPLHRRGYRLETGKAPLREDLAHALLLAAGFTRDDALLDPFCGSGTIAIEAAGLACGLPPGRLRPPPLQQFAMFDADVWERIRTERAPAAPGATAPIVAGDRDAGAIAAATANAQRAGLAHAIRFVHAPFAAQPWFGKGDDAPPTRGLIATNPPFGVRVGKGGDLRPLYQTLGHRSARLGAGWRIVLLAHDLRLARRTGLDLRAAFTTRHGGLSVTALLGDVEKPAASGTARSQ